MTATAGTTGADSAESRSANQLATPIIPTTSTAMPIHTDGDPRLAGSVGWGTTTPLVGDSAPKGARHRGQREAPSTDGAPQDAQ